MHSKSIKGNINLQRKNVLTLYLYIKLRLENNVSFLSTTKYS
jgi:hypothetical protein